MAVSGNQLTRIGQYNSGTAKKLTIIAKTASTTPTTYPYRGFIGKNINRIGLR